MYSWVDEGLKDRCKIPMESFFFFGNYKAEVCKTVWSVVCFAFLSLLFLVL